MESAGHTHHHYSLNQRITRLIGADMRLLYGIAVPMFATIGFVIALAATGLSWMVGPVVVFLLVTVSVVVFGLLGMLDEDDEESTG